MTSADVTVTVNGEKQRVPGGESLAALLGRRGVPARGVAVAIDAAVVPASAWSETRLRGGETIEILTAVQGG